MQTLRGKVAVVTGGGGTVGNAIVDHPDIALITFTRAGAKVFTERLPFDVGYAGTLHSFLLRLLKTQGRVIGFSPRLSVIDEEIGRAHV